MRTTRHPFLVGMALSLAAATALGFARFAYSLLLPSMRLAMGWNFLAAGAMNTVNAVGYLAGALAVPRISDIFGNRRTFFWSSVAMVVSLAATPLFAHLLPLAVLRLASGFCGAQLFVIGSSLAQSATKGLPSSKAAIVLGIYYGGAGVGTAASGVVIPLIHGSPTTIWHAGWEALALLTLVSVAIASWGALQVEDPPRRAPLDRHLGHYRPLLPALVAYGLFGLGYLAFLTFQVSFLEHEAAPQSFIEISYVVVGLVAAVSTWVWYRPLGGGQPGRVAALIYLAGALGAAVFLVSGSLVVVVIGSILFGLALMSCSTAFSVMTRVMLPSSLQTGAMGVATVAIAIGQAVGPTLAGAVADTSAGLAGAIGFGAAMILVAALVSVAQRMPESETFQAPSG